MALRTAFAVVFATLALGLAGCGFTPLYATPGVSPGLAAIEISAPKGRVGYLLREDLDDALAHNKDAAPRWRLDMEIVSARDPRGLRRDDVAESRAQRRGDHRSQLRRRRPALRRHRRA